MNHFPEFVTLTGIDHGTSTNAAALMSKKYPIEWGVLLSKSRQGTGRCPDLDFVRNLIMPDYRYEEIVYSRSMEEGVIQPIQ